MILASDLNFHDIFPFNDHKSSLHVLVVNHHSLTISFMRGTTVYLELFYLLIILLYM